MVFVVVREGGPPARKFLGSRENNPALRAQRARQSQITGMMRPWFVRTTEVGDQSSEQDRPGNCHPKRPENPSQNPREKFPRTAASREPSGNAHGSTRRMESHRHCADPRDRTRRRWNARYARGQGRHETNTPRPIEGRLTPGQFATVCKAESQPTIVAWEHCPVKVSGKAAKREHK